MNGYKLLLSAALGLFLTGAGASAARADMADVESSAGVASEASITAGYRATSVHGAPGRALEYDSLTSSPLFQGRLYTDRGPYHLDLGLVYRNEDDYAAEAHLDTNGLLRLDLRSERFFHNLDHIPYDNGQASLPASTTTLRRTGGHPVDGSRPDALFPTVRTPRYTDLALTKPALSKGKPTYQDPTYRAFYTDHNPDDSYGLRIDVNEAKLKIKCPDYPAHLNLSYWRYEKEGRKQLRFSSEGGTGGSCNGCHMQSKTRDIDRVTEEFKAEVDAHAGYVDVVLETLFRTFRDREEIPNDIFGVHSRGRTFNDYEHNEDPDNRLKEATLRLNTAPSGGLVGSASFTIGERENRSDLVSVGPIDAETNYYKTAADVTYTPGQNWTFNLRYRLLDMDSDNTGSLTAHGSTNPNSLEVRDAMDMTRAWYEAIVNYRPSSHLSLKGEVRREEIDRGNTGHPVAHVSSATLPIKINPIWELPEEEVITRYKLGFNSRFLAKSALKINGWLAFQENDDPAYGTSFGESRELFLATSYTPSPLWGVQANANLQRQENDDHEFDGFDLEREKQQRNLSLGSWVTPREGLTLDLNYGYFRTIISQDLLFGAAERFAIENEDVDYRQTVHSVTAGVTWQALKKLACRVEGYHIRSQSSFSPDFASQRFVYGRANAYFPGMASSADLKEISKLDLRQNGVRGRVDWQVNANWSCGMEATLDDYDERGNDVFDGSVQSYMASVSYTF